MIKAEWTNEDALDVINRQGAITIPVMPKEHRHYQTNNLDDAYDQGWFDLQNCIERLPSAEPERKTGRWIYDNEAYPYGNPCGHYDCDQCGESVPHKTNFCPNCGCKMEVENEC